jgi:hypothetical protein
MLMKGFADRTDRDPIPFLEDYKLCRHLRWTWDAAQDVPLPVRQVFLLCIDSEIAAQRGAIST